MVKFLWKLFFLPFCHQGKGISDQDKEHLFHYFYSTAPISTPTYTYSGNFGVPFTGLGCGLPLAKLYAKYHGGDLQLQSTVGLGTDAFVYLDKRFGISQRWYSCML